MDTLMMGTENLRHEAFKAQHRAWRAYYRAFSNGQHDKVDRLWNRWSQIWDLYHSHDYEGAISKAKSKK